MKDNYYKNISTMLQWDYISKGFFAVQNELNIVSWYVIVINPFYGVIFKIITHKFLKDRLIL